MKISRKLELNGYLTKPTTRLGRYNLILREVLRHTPKDHPDQENIAKAMKIIANFLTIVNRETGKTESRHNLYLLEQRLVNQRQADMVVKLYSYIFSVSIFITCSAIYKLIYTYLNIYLGFGITCRKSSISI